VDGECVPASTMVSCSDLPDAKVKLITECHMMIGIAPNETNPDGPNWNSCGLYLSTQSGALFGADGTWKQDYGAFAARVSGFWLKKTGSQR
jgi:hypothetical protein